MNVNSPRYGLAVLLAATFSAAAAEPTASKLVGIVCIEKRKQALLELKEQTPSGLIVTRKPILGEGESDGTFAVTAIDEKAATVSMRHGVESFVLRLDQAPGEELGNRTLQFRSAGLQQVLDIYQEVTGRTLISNARVWPEITVKSGARLSPEKTSEWLTNAFSEVGMAVKLGGKDFAFVVESDRAHELSGIPEPPPFPLALRIRQEELLSKVGLDEFAGIIPPGVIRFMDTDLWQVLDIYQELTGRTVIRPQQLRSAKITVKSQTPMTRRQVVWLLDALLFVQGGLTMTMQAEKFVYAVPRDSNKSLPKAAPQMRAAASASKISARTMRYSDAEVRQMVQLYEELSGREALPDAHHLFATKFSLNNQQDLTPEEAMFALEAVAALNNLKFQPVGNDKFQIIPAAAATTPAR